MPRTAITITDLTENAAVAIQAVGTTLDATNDMVVTDAYDRAKGDLLFQVENTGNTTGAITFVAGTDDPAGRRGIGNLAITVATSTKVLIPEVESARFFQAGEDMNINVATGVVGTIACFRLPRGGVA